MGLSANKVFKVMEKKFRDNGPALNIAEPLAREQMAKEIYQKMKSFEKKYPALLSLHSSDHYSYTYLALKNQKNSVVFSIHTAWRQPPPYLAITFDDKGNLIITGYDPNDDSKKGPFLCRHIEDIDSLLELLKTEQVKADQADKKREKTALQNEKKHEKIRDLKYSAITAKIKELAAAEKLIYALEAYHTKVKFLIKLSESEMFAIDIPYKHFQSVLQNIKTAVAALFDLRAKGITIKHTRFTPSKAPQWSEHD